jgi:hypothetical protein
MPSASGAELILSADGIEAWEAGAASRRQELDPMLILRDFQTASVLISMLK